MAARPAPVRRLAAPVGPGDPYLNLWILGWDLRTISLDPLALVTGRIFDANIFFPAAGTLAYSDHLILQAVILLWPLLAVTRNLIFCYNALLFLSLVASALDDVLLARARHGVATPARLSAGLAWGFFPFRFAHLLHLQLQSLYFLPLAFLFLHRVVAGRRRRDAVWLGVIAGAAGDLVGLLGVDRRDRLVSARRSWRSRSDGGAACRFSGGCCWRRWLGAALVAPFAGPTGGAAP